MSLDIGERDVYGFAGYSMVFTSCWVLWGFGAAIGVLGCLLVAASLLGVPGTMGGGEA